MNNTDKAETGDLKRLLAIIGEGLDQYLKFEHPDALQSANRWQEILRQPIPEHGVGINQVAKELVDDLIAHGSPVPKPGFTSFITTGATTASTLALTAASIASPQRYMRTAFNFVEELSLDWLAELCGISGMKGLYSSGGSTANLVALGGARQSAFEALGHDPALHGNNREVRIYASDQCHHTIQRSAGVLGLGRRCVTPISTDLLGRMNVDALREAIQADINSGLLPMAVVANAGTTNTGVIDPLQEIGEVAGQFNIWYHIDGAYGLPGILDDRLADHYRGIELADSVIVDPHKWLGASVGVAATFVKDREILKRAFTQEPADYLEGSVDEIENQAGRFEHSLDDFGIPYFDYGVELSAPCRGVAVWAMIREIGVSGMRERVVRHNTMARKLARIAETNKNFELLSPATLSICCFRFVSSEVDDLDSLNQRLHRLLVRENIYMPSTTRVQGKLALRPCFVGARSEAEQVDGLVESVLRIGHKLVAESR